MSDLTGEMARPLPLNVHFSAVLTHGGWGTVSKDQALSQSSPQGLDFEINIMGSILTMTQVTFFNALPTLCLTWMSLSIDLEFGKERNVVN